MIIKQADTDFDHPARQCKIVYTPDKQLKANLIEAYNQQAEQRNKSEIEDWKVAERARFLSLLQQENKRALLEIGAGHGRDSLFFKEHGFEVTGVDMSPAMPVSAERKVSWSA